MANYTGSAYNFYLTQTLITGAQFHLVFTFDTIPFASAVMLSYRPVSGGAWNNDTAGFTSPRTRTIPEGDYEYQATVYFSNGDSPLVVTFTLVVADAIDNYIYTPELNPLIWYDEGRATTPYYQTPHFEQFPHAERGKPWLQGDVWHQVWQTTDIIYLQFSSTFDPIVIDLLNEEGFVVRSWVGLNKLPNREFPNLYVFEFALSLAGLITGCYSFRRTLGSGDGQKIQTTCCQYISADPLLNTIYIEYKNSKFTKDVLFETGIKFGLRLYGWIDYDKMKSEKKEEGYRDQRYTSKKTSSKSAKSIPVYFGDEMGLPAEKTNLVEEIYGLDEVTIDGAFFTLPPDKEFEYTEENGYRMRGMKAELEPGLTRYSRITKVNFDPQKKLMYAIAVDQHAISDTTGQGNNNVVPIYNVVIQ